MALRVRGAKSGARILLWTGHTAQRENNLPVQTRLRAVEGGRHVVQVLAQVTILSVHSKLQRVVHLVVAVHALCHTCKVSLRLGTGRARGKTKTFKVSSF